MQRRMLRGFCLAVAVTIGLAGCGGGDGGAVAPGAADERRFNWKMVTAWPPNLPINHDAVVRFAEEVGTMSRGRLSIQVFAGGELIPPLQAFDAVSQGSVEMAHAAAYYWAGKVPAAQFLTVVPFGMTQKGAWAWIYGGGGLELWRELYEPFGVIPFPMGNTGIQMGGWFNKKIESIEDLEGLKMRIPGLGGKVLAKAGGNPVLLSAAEIYTALERGTIDATEWVGPLHDQRFGLDRAAKYYYYPGWHEPGTQLELLVNAEAWASLPEDLQRIVEAAAASASLYMYGRSEVENARAFLELKNNGHTEVLEFPREVTDRLAEMTREVMAEEAARDPDFKRVLESYEAFRAGQAEFHAVTERAYQAVLEHAGD
ncbi:MAG: TRAP transporter substrate-binding protein [Gammaproteobacteria bacterium]